VKADREEHIFDGTRLIFAHDSSSLFTEPRQRSPNFDWHSRKQQLGMVNLWIYFASTSLMARILELDAQFGSNL
jgi:hypothetical protein